MVTKLRKQAARRATFKVSAFRARHGHLPRGVAFWVFYFGDAPTEPWIARDHNRQLLRTSYMQAKAFATAEARRRGAFYLTVDEYPL